MAPSTRSIAEIGIIFRIGQNQIYVNLSHTV